MKPVLRWATIQRGELEHVWWSDATEADVKKSLNRAAGERCARVRIIEIRKEKTHGKVRK
jgi:hypothetical protein